MSNEQKKYLKKIKIKRYIILLVQILIIITFFSIWEFLAQKSIINTFIFSSPSRILKTIINLYRTNNLIPHILTTLYEVSKNLIPVNSFTYTIQEAV